MSIMSEAFAAAEESLFELKGDDATYKPASGFPFKTRAILYENVEVLPAGFDATVTATETHIGLPVSDFKTAPKKHDVIVINGVNYKVDDWANFGNTHGKYRVVVRRG
jgi:hypothetical protein